MGINWPWTDVGWKLEDVPYYSKVLDQFFWGKCKGKILVWNEAGRIMKVKIGPVFQKEWSGFGNSFSHFSCFTYATINADRYCLSWLYALPVFCSKLLWTWQSRSIKLFLKIFMHSSCIMLMFSKYFVDMSDIVTVSWTH